MRVLDKYIISSILKGAVIATLTLVLILVGVELFSRIDSILTGGIDFFSILSYAFLCSSEYFILVLSIALLFSSTLFQSQLSSNNERIALLNAGVSKKRFFIPIFTLAIIITLSAFLLNETVIKKANSKKEILSETLFGQSSTQDSRNIVLNDDNYIIFATRFSEKNKKIYDPIVIRVENGDLIERLSALKAEYNGENWVFIDSSLITNSNSRVEEKEYSKYSLDDLKIDPSYFKSTNIDIETMDIKSALNYLERLKKTNREAWQEKASNYYRNFFQPLTILLLLSITAFMDYGSKKNVLLFSVIQSLSIAVVYYCLDMVISICSYQGLIYPIWTVILPIVFTILFALIINEVGKKL